MTFKVVKLSRDSLLTSGAPEILGVGGDHDDLHPAMVEATARQLATGTDGGSIDWQVVEVSDEARMPIHGEECEPDEVLHYLVDCLGVPFDQAERLVQ